jgi:hypothetical protein
MIQVSLEVSDRPGELSRVVSLLASRNVDVKALYVSRASPSATVGTVRMIVTDPPAAVEALQAGGLDPVQESVVVVAVDDHPGGLAAALDALAKQQLNLLYAYGFVSRIEGKALSILGVADAPAAASILRGAGFTLLHAQPGSASDDPDPSAYVGGVWNW